MQLFLITENKLHAYISPYVYTNMYRAEKGEENRGANREVGVKHQRANIYIFAVFRYLLGDDLLHRHFDLDFLVLYNLYWHFLVDDRFNRYSCVCGKDRDR